MHRKKRVAPDFGGVRICLYTSHRNVKLNINVKNKGARKLKKQNFKKLLCALLSASLMASGMTAFASNGSSRYTLSAFQTFGDYVKEDDSAVYPDGWAKWVQGSGAVNLRGKTEITTGSNAMYVLTNAIPRFNFDTLVQEGIAHIGFDMKLEEGAGVRIMGSTDFTGSKNPNSVYHDSHELVVQNYYLDLNYAIGGKVTLFTGDAGIQVWSTETVDESDTAWHRYDLIIDMEHGTYTPYIDGAKIVKSQTVAGEDDEGNSIYEYTYYENLKSNYNLKNIYFQTTGGNIWLDNFTAENYATPAEGVLAAPQVKADFNNGKVDIAYSEAVNLSSVAASSVSATNVETGNTVSATAFTKTATGAVIDFGDLPNGTYYVNLPRVSGKISGKTAVGNPAFSVVKTINANEKELVLIDEDFADYTGEGAPTGWATLTTGTYDKATLTQGTKGNGEKTFVMSGNGAGSYYYNFDGGYALHGENFTVEFDVNSANAGWGIGIMRDSDMNTYKYSTMDRYNGTFGNTDYSVIAGRYQKVNNMFAGVYEYLNSEDTSEENSVKGTFVTQNNVYNLWTLAKTSNSANKATEYDYGTWAHFKLNINPQAGKVDVYKDGEFVVQNTYPVNMFAGVKQTDDENKNPTYSDGIAGIRLHKEAGCSSVAFANIKVSKDNSYLTYQDFEGRVTANENSVGWIAGAYIGWYQDGVKKGGVYEGQDQTKTQFKTTAGKNSNTALEIYSMKGAERWEAVKTILNKPVTKGKGFVIEFDAKKSTGNGWFMGAATTAGATVGTVTGTLLQIKNDGKVQFGTGYDSNYTQPGYGDDYGTEKNPVTIGDGVWYHYKYIINPNTADDGNKTTRYLQITDESGNTQELYANVRNDNVANRLRNENTVAIEFMANWTPAGVPFAIDNLKVWEIEPDDATGKEPTNKSVYMQYAKAVSYDGSEEFFETDLDKLKDTKELVFKFSDKLTEDAKSKISVKVNEAEIGTKTIDGDKLIVSLAGVVIPENKSVKIKVESGIACEGGVTEDSHSYDISSHSSSGLVINSIDLYENVAPTALDMTKGITANADVLVKNIARITGKPVFIIKGYNTGEATTALVADANYNVVNSGSEVKAIKKEDKTVAAGSAFEWRLDASDVINADGNQIKAFVWDAAQKALIENYMSTK